MQIQVLGSSSEGNGYIVSDGKTTIMLECGLPIAELKIKTNFFDPMPAACLISHSHGDHAKSVRDIIRLGIPCYMSNATFVDKVGDLASSYPLITPIEHQRRFSVGTFDIVPLEMKHDVYCLGFYIYSRETKESLFFATDTCYIPYKLPPMDYIMVEANYDIDILNDRIMNGYVDPAMKNRLARSHMEIGQTILWLRKQDLSKARRIYLLHLSYGSSNAEEFKNRVVECAGVPTIIAGG